MAAANPPAPPANVYFGGQAVIEGVMIRGPEHMAVAVRHPKGHIVTHSEKLGGIYTGRSRRIPLMRGVVVLWETMALGMRALNYSSRIAFEEDTDENGEPADARILMECALACGKPDAAAGAMEWADKSRHEDRNIQELAVKLKGMEKN